MKGKTYGPKEFVSRLGERWVVEDTRTGYKYITDAWEAYSATFSSETTMWEPRRLSYIKTYPIKELGPAAEILFKGK